MLDESSQLTQDKLLRILKAGRPVALSLIDDLGMA
jgi:hypothetical protein